MIKRRLSRLISAVLIGASLLGSTLMFWTEVRLATRGIEKSAIDSVNATMTYLQNVLNTQMANDDFEAARLTMSVTTLHPDIETILLTSDRDRILLANRYIWEGEQASLRTLYDSGLASRVRAQRTKRVALDSESQVLYGYYPINLKIGTVGLMADRMGILYVEHDLSAPIARARYDAILWSAAFAVLAISVSMIIAMMLNRLVARRAERIVEATHKVAAGDLSTRVELEGQDELAELAHAFNEMVKQRMHDEVLLRHSEESLRYMLQTSPIAVTIASEAEHAILFANESYCGLVNVEHSNILGRNPREFYANADNCKEVLRELAAGNSVTDRLVELKVDGEGQKWTLASYMKLEYQHQPAILEWFYDITERKRFEDEMQLASLVYQNSGEAIEVVDENTRIIAINPAYTEMTGYTEEEVLGKTPAVLSSGRHDDSFYRDMWQALNESGHWQGEIWDRRKDGEVFPIWTTINTVYNDDGAVHRRVAIFTDISKRKEAEELIWKQANFDALTGLPNRRMFRDRLEQELKKSQRSKQMLALLFIDLDRFKEINDTLGHHYGDVLLIEAGERIRENVRESDTVARLGGDEFTVIVSQLRYHEHVEEVAEKIISALRQPFYLGEQEIHLSASVGITLYPDDSDELEQLLKNADQAMYVAKQEGRNRYSYFTQSLQEQAQRRLRMIADMRSALAEEQFTLHYQPIVELKSGRIIKAEALLRWIHPTRGFVSPAEFIPIAEEIGLINEIGDWVFREVVSCLKHWTATIDSDFQVSVNMSPVQFHGDNQSGQGWLQLLRESGLSGSNVVVEITEGLLLDAEKKVTDRLLTYRDAGLEVAIDDFGTGYSALSYLNKFDIDYLKIDKSFIDDIASDESHMALSEAIVVMAHKLGLKVVAEGIEQQEQCELLNRAGCDYGQGYLFSRPLPAEEFEQLIRQQREGKSAC